MYVMHKIFSECKLQCILKEQKDLTKTTVHISIFRLYLWFKY